MFEQRHIAFFTATILEWKHLLKPDKYKAIVLASLRYLVANKRVKVYAFVIMPNHLHLLWKMEEPHKREDVQRDFLRFTAQKIKYDLVKNHQAVLEKFRVDAKDRQYQVWERNPLSVYCYSVKVTEQKLDYIHQNPTQEKWQLATLPEEYFYSSASFYHNNTDAFSFLTHYLD
ncbi:transposase IS200 family protein [Pontibacter ummariensis]|uniref:Transposase IS200 like n=1 Tax=Pontibacter ummariensis TaxID=1610492 RepID=A0A239CPB0_9BACT|nr:transposase [Pontibacter ummariensis]PRY14913.1 transposase IS200 family protein [Pontibacter ummariensis]SNS21702.1 Transposase IS200 like [Pontibacter ummariensis]